MSASQDWLAHFANECRRNIAAIRRLDRRMVTIDTAARKAEVQWARGYLAHRPRLIKELEKRGQSEEEWRAGLGPGHSISQVRRAIQLARPGAFARYVRRRRALGACHTRSNGARRPTKAKQPRIWRFAVNAPAKRQQRSRRPAPVRPNSLRAPPNWRTYSRLRRRQGRWAEQPAPQCRRGVTG